MRNSFLGVLIAGFALMACGDGDIREIVDPEVQRDVDVELIDEFLIENGFSEDQVGTTALGVRYIILDSGMTQFDSLIIDESDIVDFDFIGRLTNDTLFDTSIRSVAEGTSVFTEARIYRPFTINYTSTGWAISGNFLTGFSDGITNTFDKMNIGGRSLIIIPSDLAYGLAPPFGSNIPQNAILTFELLPVGIRKQ